MYLTRYWFVTDTIIHRPFPITPADNCTKGNRYTAMTIGVQNHLKVIYFAHGIFWESYILTTHIIIGEQVLVIGAGPSGMDLAYEISKFATRVTLSHHHKTDPLTKFPGNVDLRPDVSKLTESGAEFVDGTYQDYSVIFYCTGKFEQIFIRRWIFLLLLLQ